MCAKETLKISRVVNSLSTPGEHSVLKLTLNRDTNNARRRAGGEKGVCCVTRLLCKVNLHEPGKAENSRGFEHIHVHVATLLIAFEVDGELQEMFQLMSAPD